MKVFVFVDLGGETLRVGQLFTDFRRGRLTSTFSYDNEYLSHRHAYPIDPGLPLSSGTWPVAGTLPRVFLDAAPDRWGRNLIMRRAITEATATHPGAPSLSELDYLLGVNDASRQGALRFKVSDERGFEHPDEGVPKMVQLPALVEAAHHVAAGDDHVDDAVKILLDMGSASLGGARPKASVRDGQRMMMAKFAHPHDQWNVMAWEKTALDLAETAEVEVPGRRLIDVGGSPVLLIDRFDRTSEGCRIGYMSAMTLCEADDGDRLDYLHIADRLAVVSSSPQQDLEQLWRRIVLGIAINNTDDHLRNHGFVRARAGWRLSPVFDLNPDPSISTFHATSISGQTASADAAAAALECVSFFALTSDKARNIVRTVLDAVKQWQNIASRNGISRTEMTRFSPVFEQGISALELGL